MPMTDLTLDKINRHAAKALLEVMGCVDQGLPDGLNSLVLLGPKEPEFWPAFTASEEFKDGKPDPTDRWSLRVVGQLADELGGKAFFPFTGPPYQPFLKWARDSGRAFVSPVGPLVHDTAGMMISYRGAIGFAQVFDMPETAPSPCETCAEKPCQTSCPVDAFASGEYDVAACKADLDRPGNDCMTRGCAVRRACPISQSFDRLEAHSAFHMRAFR